MKWSIREMLLCLVIAALAIPWVLSMRRNQDVQTGLIPLHFPNEYLQTSILEFDPSANLVDGNGVGGGSGLSDVDWSFELSNHGSEKVFAFICKQINEKLRAENWMTREFSGTKKTASWVLTQDDSMYRVFLFQLEPDEGVQQRAREKGLKSIRLRLLVIGYTTRVGRYKMIK